MPRTHYQLLGVAPNATRAEIDAGLTRRESQYRDLVRTGQRPDQRIIERVRRAHATLVDPEKRAAYDRSLARAARRAPPPARSSWPSTGPDADDGARGTFLGRAWKPLALTIVPAALAAGAALPAGERVMAWAGALSPWLPVALLGLLAALCMAGAVLLWRCAPDAERPAPGHFARAVSILALAGVGLALYAAATGPLLRVVP